MKQIKIWPVLLIVVFVVGCFVVGVLYNDTYVNITKDTVSTKQTSDTVKASEFEPVLTNDSIQPKEGQSEISKTNDNTTKGSGRNTNTSGIKTVQDGTNNKQENEYDNTSKSIETKQSGSNNYQKNVYH